MPAANDKIKSTTMTRKYFLFSLVTFLFEIQVYGQNTQSINFEKVFQFLNSTMTNDTLKFNLSEETGFGIFGDDTASIYKDTLFDNDDIEFFRRQVTMMEKTTWQKDQITGANVISQSKIKRIFRGKNGWNRFRKKYGNCLTTFSMPVFSKNYNYCIFYHWTQCDYLAGGGSLDLYKLENGKWIFVKSYMMGVS